MTGNEFIEALTGEFDLSAADQILAEAIAREIDAARSTHSARDVRSTDRLINEMVRTLYSRIDAGENSDAGSRSQAARRMALTRWHGVA